MANRRTYSDRDANSQSHYSDERTPTLSGKDRLCRRGCGTVGTLKGRGRGRGARRGCGSSHNSEPVNLGRNLDTITQRVLSASRNKVNEMGNKVEEQKIQIRDLQQENRLYKRTQFRQEKALRGFEDNENDPSNILEKHNNEVRSLKELNRKMREKYEKSDLYLHNAENELERLKNQLKKYKDMAYEKDLLERGEPSKKVTKAEIDLEERNNKIKELQRHIDILKKNHHHELSIEVARRKKLKRHVDELQSKNTKLATQLKEKEKELVYKNIYSNRPALDNSEHGSPASKSKKKASSITDLKPREKAMFYAQKVMEEPRKKNKDLERRQEQHSWRENEDREKRERELLAKRNLEREENEMQEREGKERKEREEKETLERERLERERKERIEAVSREREKAEQDRRLQLEQQKLGNDPAILEERTKKNELLKKLQAMDELSSAGTKRDVINTSPQHSGVKENSHSCSSGNGFDSPSKRSESKEYSFTKPVNNLHQAKPSHDDVNMPYIDKKSNSRQGISKDIDFGYQPSFAPSLAGASNAPATMTRHISIFDDGDLAFKPVGGVYSSNNRNVFPGKYQKTSNLLENLFGPQTASSKKEPMNKSGEEAFFMKNKSPQPNSKKSNNSVTVFPWDTTPSSPSKANGNFDGRSGSTIYGDRGGFIG